MANTKQTPSKSKNAAAAAPAKKDALATRATSAVTTGGSMDDLLAQTAGAGSENIGVKDMTIPRISLLQSGSPQVKKSDGKYIKGAEEGDFYDNIANAVFAKGDTGFLFIPVSYRRANIEWIPKDDGGGFVADHGADDSILAKCVKDDKNRMMIRGHEIVTTAEYYGYALPFDGKKVTGDAKQVVISLAKTQLKKARKLNTAIKTLTVPHPRTGQPFNPAMFYSIFHATSVPESKNEYNWMGWNLPRWGNTLELDGGEQLFREAIAFRDAVSAGIVKAAAPSDLDAVGGNDGSPDDGATL